MKRLILGGLSILLLFAATTPAVLAQSAPSNPAVSDSDSTYLVEPFNLVYLAYQGYFKEQGIPSSQALIMAYITGDVSAKDIVSSAIETDRLPLQAMADEEYINAVENQLRQLSIQRQR